MSAARSWSFPTNRRTTRSMCGAWRVHNARSAASSPSIAWRIVRSSTVTVNWSLARGERLLVVIGGQWSLVSVRVVNDRPPTTDHRSPTTSVWGTVAYVPLARPVSVRHYFRLRPPPLEPWSHSSSKALRVTGCFLPAVRHFAVIVARHLHSRRYRQAR